MSLSRNILIFNHNYGPQFVDISNQYARLFDQPNDQVTVVYLTGAYDQEIKNKTIAQEVIFLNSPPAVTRGLKLRAIYRMWQLQRRKRFNVVICHRYKPTYIMLWLSLFYRFPVFISVMHELGTLRAWMRKLLIACLAPKNMIFAGVSHAVRNDMRQDMSWLPPGRVLTLYNMIDVELTEPQLYSREEARQRLQLPPEAFVFGSLGRLVKNKDHASLIAAFALIKTQCPQAKLIILGAGQLESELKQQVSLLGLSAEVIFAGFVSEGFRYMKAFDVYISSSIQEAFGRVLLEAMIAQLPIIATHVHGMPEVLGDTGILVKAASPEELSAAMLVLYQESAQQRKNRAEAGYQRAKEAFSIPRFKEIMSQILLPGLDSNQ